MLFEGKPSAKIYCNVNPKSVDTTFLRKIRRNWFRRCVYKFELSIKINHRRKEFINRKNKLC